ncbi:MAG TPA: DEAD/DEAH box helicase family protein [Patescibacteria group bacterium]|nr:DEAD/DEAH box helicase family protein [Patescibacteria group bacterium]
MKANYKYQTEAAEQVLKNALNKQYIASVLAACPNSGKTTISHIIINKYIQIYPNANILVLTEGQKTLQDQYLAELKDANVHIRFTYGTFGSNAQVQVGLPQGINKLEWDKVDLLIVDECHRWFLENTDQKIINKYRPEHIVLMSGTPSKFNLHNQTSSKKYGMYYISADELQKNDVFSAVDMDVIGVGFQNNIKDVWGKLQDRQANLSKVMIACGSILQANTVVNYLKSIGRKCVVSTSSNDKENKNINEFKNGKYDVLIVVDRGILGFNDPNITTLIDMKKSSNIDSSFQLFARVLRNHKDNIKKSYFRVTDKSYNKEVIMLHKIVALMDSRNFRLFNGKNLKISQ